MDSFKYLRADTVEQACNWLTEYGEDAKVLAGGQSLVYLLKEKLLSPAYVIDIRGLADLDYLRFNENGGLLVGALTTHRTLERSALIRERCLMVAEMEKTLASVAVRNWGTLGGSLAHADPTSDVAPTFMALDAEVVLKGPKGDRVIGLENFCVDMFETAMECDELLTEVRLPLVGKGGGCYYKFAQRDHDAAIVSVAVHITRDGGNPGVCEDIRVVIGSSGPVPQRMKRAEGLVRGKEINNGTIEEVAKAAAEDAQVTGSLSGSAEYQREILPVLVARAVRKAAERT